MYSLVSAKEDQEQRPQKKKNGSGAPAIQLEFYIGSIILQGNEMSRGTLADWVSEAYDRLQVFLILPETGSERGIRKKVEMRQRRGSTIRRLERRIGRQGDAHVIAMERFNRIESLSPL